MNLHFERPVSAAALEKIKAHFGDPVAHDEHTVLLDNVATPIRSSVMGDIARAAGQPVAVAIVGPGRIASLTDGRQYELTSVGWRKLRTQ